MRTRVHRRASESGACRAVAREERAGESHKMAFTECSTGARFQITFEASGYFLGFEREVGFEFPGTIFGSVARNISLVLLNPVTQILSVADIKMFWRRDRFEDVDVMHLHSPVRLRPYQRDYGATLSPFG
jgi:hypothetical protein